MQAQAKQYLTPEEYLRIERQAAYKSEFWHGEMFAMAGASEAHNTIVANLSFLLVGQLKGRDCKAYASDLRVKVSEAGNYAYPDLVIVCGTRKFEDKILDILANPTVIIEVLSDLTEAFDRGEKFEQYRRIESLSDYLLVSQSKQKIEHFKRQAEGPWVLSESFGMNDSLAIESIGCRLSLQEVYDKVEFEPRDLRPELRRVR